MRADRPDPVLVFATPGPDAPRVAAMLGAHPAGAVLPELHLGCVHQYRALRTLQVRGHLRLEDGWLRAIADCFFGAQTEATVQQARQWLDRRRDEALGALLDTLVTTLSPRCALLPDSIAPWRIVDLERAAAAASHATGGVRILHLVAHPWPDCERMAAAQRDALFVASDYRDFGPGHDRAELDPQLAWLRIHGNLLRAFAEAPESHYRRLDLHRLHANPGAELTALCQWLGWPARASVLTAMQHPELTPFAHQGPESAPFGADPDFLRRPEFVARLRPLRGLRQPLPWRSDGAGFAPEVVAMAERLDLA